MYDIKKGLTFCLKGLPIVDVLNDQEINTVAHETHREYEFYIGPLSYVPEKDMIFLHIPEMNHRDAEGRPFYPEQEQWINSALAEFKIRAKDYWWSHWKFESEIEAEKFIHLLLDLNATEKT